MAANPLLHFAVRNITFTPTDTGYIVVCYSNLPVHLYMRWTATTPQKHIHPTIVRGAQVGTYIDQCFVVFTDVEQQEVGDTYTHTFIIEPWAYCQTRWFYFWGTVSGIVSPSASCILSYHSSVIPFMDFYPAPLTGGDSVDGRVGRVLANQTWALIRDGPGNQANPTGTTDRASISAYSTPDRWDSIHRSILTFPTATLGNDCAIQSATLRLWCTYRLVDPPWTPGVAVYGATPAVYNNLQNSDYNQCQATPRTNILAFASINPNSYFELEFTSFGLLLINKSGPTELCLREAYYDAANSPPPWQINNDCDLLWASADHLTSAYHPRLRVYYLP